MSILADLLSKNRPGEAQGGKEIPPTLAKSLSAPAPKRTTPKRYIFIAIASVIVIGIGLATPFFLRTMATPKTVKYPLPPMAAAPVAPPQPAAPPVQPQPAPQAPPEAEPQPKPKPKATYATRHAPKPHTRIAAKPAASWRPAMAGSSGKASRNNRNTAAAARVEPPASSPGDTTAIKDVFLYAARSAEQAGDWRSAIANYRKALEIDPGNHKILSNVAAALNNLGMYDEGAREARKALSRKPDYLPAMINAAIAYSSSGNSKEALRLFAAACLADPSNRNLAINLGILQERTGKLDEAQATYRRLADSGEPLAFMGLGRVAERKGNRAEAAGNYRQILALRNASPSQKQEAKERLVRLEE